MANYSIRIWAEGDGHWCEVRLRNRERTLVSTAFLPGSIKAARADGRDAIAKHQAERRLARAA